jgi:hypothetical protein
MPSSPDREAQPDQLEVVRIVLEAGDFVHLRRNELHALEALVDSSALLTFCIAKASRPARRRARACGPARTALRAVRALFLMFPKESEHRLNAWSFAPI